MSCFGEDSCRSKSSIERQERLDALLNDSKKLLDWLRKTRSSAEVRGQYGSSSGSVMKQLDSQRKLLEDLYSREISFVKMLERFDGMIHSARKSSK